MRNLEIDNDYEKGCYSRLWANNSEFEAFGKNKKESLKMILKQLEKEYYSLDKTIRLLKKEIKNA